MWTRHGDGNYESVDASAFVGTNLENIANFCIARHPPTIQKLICPSRRANASRNLPDGEAAKLEEAQQQAETKTAPTHRRPLFGDHLTFGVAGNPDPPVRRLLGAQRFHNIDARSACRGQHRCDNRNRHQQERRDKYRQCARHLDFQEISSRQTRQH